jgi:hypothetical protein
MEIGLSTLTQWISQPSVPEPFLSKKRFWKLYREVRASVFARRKEEDDLLYEAVRLVNAKELEIRARWEARAIARSIGKAVVTGKGVRL